MGFLTRVYEYVSFRLDGTISIVETTCGFIFAIFDARLSALLATADSVFLLKLLE